MVEGLHERISSLANVIYSTNNQVQIRLTTIETQLDESQRKLEESLELFVPKRGRATHYISLTIAYRRGRASHERRCAH